MSRKNHKIDELEYREEMDELEEDELTHSTKRMLIILKILVFTIVPILLFYLMEGFDIVRVSWLSCPVLM